MRSTVYVCNIDPVISETVLTQYFNVTCGPVLDVRMCVDPRLHTGENGIPAAPPGTPTALRFAFVQFYDEAAARVALQMSGTTVGSMPIRVLPSRTAINPITPELLPMSDGDAERVTRTVYGANLPSCVGRDELERYFETRAGPVSMMVLLRDPHRKSSRIAFIEFADPDSARRAIEFNGARLSADPAHPGVRLTMSKTPVYATKAEIDDAIASTTTGCTGAGPARAKHKPRVPQRQLSGPSVLVA